MNKPAVTRTTLLLTNQIHLQHALRTMADAVGIEETNIFKTSNLLADHLLLGSVQF